MNFCRSKRKLNRSGSHRKSMFRNMINNLVKYEIIKTTLPKAKELKGIVEYIITFSKIDSVANRRLVFSNVRNNQAVSKIFNELGKRFLHFSGGYTRILKCGTRAGDNANMAYIEFIDRNSINSANSRN